jgi:hypothetical protein
METNIFGCYLQIGFDPALSESDFMNLAQDFRKYLWGDNGICDNLKKLKRFDYGLDLDLALFQFYVKPTVVERSIIKEIESYRKKEKSIGIPIIVNNENFFSKSEGDRIQFLKDSILQKMDLLEDVVKKRKLDTNMGLLKSDLIKVLSEF